MKLAHVMAIGSVAALLSTSVLAATAESIKNAPNGGQVTLNGTVEDFDSNHTFMLRDSSGTILVDLSSTKPMVLKDGENISVSGTVNHTILGTDVVARTINENQGLGEKVGAAIDSLTGQDPAGSAQHFDIQALPKSGLVKVSGVVASVDSGKKFTLKDSTGHVDVNIKSGESASLKEGTEVMVVGNVDSGLLGKTINATDVKVLSSDAPMAEK